MNRPTVKFYDAITQEEIIREMNDEEYDTHLRDLEKSAIVEKEIEAAAAKRQAALAKLEALGLDTDDLKALGL